MKTQKLKSVHFESANDIQNLKYSTATMPKRLVTTIGKRSVLTSPDQAKDPELDTQAESPDIRLKFIPSETK